MSKTALLQEGGCSFFFYLQQPKGVRIKLNWNEMHNDLKLKQKKKKSLQVRIERSIVIINNNFINLYCAIININFQLRIVRPSKNRRFVY